jgi:hypothetical protein
VVGSENEVTADLIAELLREQHPDLAGLPLMFGARGWDNQLWRLGDDLAVRLPWATADAGELLLKEHTWLPAIAADAATRRRARGWALWKALACLLIGDAGIHGRPGGKATWRPPASAALQRLTATRP